MQLIKFGKKVIINKIKNSEKVIEIPTCIYIYFFGKIFVFNVERSSYELHPKTSKYDISNLVTFARKNKYKIHYEIGRNGEDIEISFIKTKDIQPYINIVVTNNTDFQNKEKKRWLKKEKKNMERNYMVKDYLRKENFYTLLINKDDVTSYSKYPDVCLLANIKDNIFIKIVGKKEISEELMSKLKNI